jgi:hypothetical protein
MESYQRSYPFVAQLHILSELEHAVTQNRHAGDAHRDADSGAALWDGMRRC